MALKKLVIKLKSAGGARGTSAADEMLEMLSDNWDQVQKQFKESSEAD